MSRIIEIVLFLTPLLGFVVWRVLFPSPLPPAWLIYALGGFVALMLVGLIWLRHLNASDADKAYVPAALQGDRVIPAHPAAPP
jgi:hypothetical protein